MKEFVEKLISKFEEQKGNVNGYLSYEGKKLVKYRNNCVDACKEIVNQLAEEYQSRVMIDGQYCWQTCSATEHCKECNRLCNGGIDYYENYDVLAEEYNNGWIPCSERLPEVNQKVLTCDKDGWISVNVNMPYMGVRNDFKCGYYVAWMPLPAPYQKGE